MSDKLIFEVIEEINCTKLPGVLYGRKEDAWKNIECRINNFIEENNTINITSFEIDQERSIVCIEYTDKRTNTTHYRYYEIRLRFIF